MKRIVKFLINEHNRKLWLWVIVCGVLFGFFHQSMVIPDRHKNRFIEPVRYKYLNLNKKVTEFSLNLPIKDTYLLKLKGGVSERNQPAEVFINGTILENYTSRKKQVRGTVYRILPSNLVQKGENIIRIVCKKKPSYRLGVWCRNYRGAVSGRSIFLLFDSSTYLSDHFAKVKIPRALLIGSLLLSSLWFLISHGLIRLLCFSERKIYLYSLVSVLPSASILSLFYLVSVYSPYYVVITQTLFWNYILLLSIILYCSLISRSFWLEYKSTKKMFKSPRLNQYVINAIEWVKGRELLDKFILLFMFLLVICAFSLALRVKIIADFFGNIAYLVLAAVVFIRLFKFLKG